jgi:hypothetical protein
MDDDDRCCVDVSGLEADGAYVVALRDVSSAGSGGGGVLARRAIAAAGGGASGVAGARPGTAGSPVSVAGTPIGDGGGLLHRVKWTSLKLVKKLGAGAFGAVQKMKLPNGTPVAVKANGVTCSDTAAIENERVLYDRLLLEPHPNILQVCAELIDTVTCWGIVFLLLRHISITEGL